MTPRIHVGRVARVALAALISAGVATAAATAQPTEPGTTPSLELQAWAARDHEVVLKWLEGADQRSYALVLAAYDEYVALHPDDVEAASARCRFIEQARYDPDVEEYNPNESAFAECLDELEVAFPDEPSVVLLGLESRWGDEGIARARALIEGGQGGQGGLEDWPPRDAARVYGHLARELAYRSQLEEAARAANEAMQRDPSLDLSLIVARYWQEQGDDENARQALEPHVGAPAESWELSQKADLLVEVGAYELAQKLYSRLAADPDFRPNLLLHARALEGSGDLFRAREFYVRAADEHWDQLEARRRLFLFDLEHSEGWQAVGSYERFRDVGFQADPLLRHRLALAWKNPSAPWRARDASGALMLLGVALLIAAAPLLWILPVHYVGLLRRVRHPELSPPASRWGLRHCWYVSVWILLVDCVAVYGFYYDGLDDLVGGGLSLAPDDAARLARMTLVAAGLTLLGLVPVLRRSDYGLLVHSRWSARRTLSASLGALLLIWIAIGVPLRIVSHQMAETSVVSPAGLPLAVSVTLKIIQALGTSYGLAVQAGFVVLMAPLYEELVFRGVLLQGCNRYLSFGWANLIQAGIFATSHEAVSYYPFYFAIGIVAGIFAKRSGGLGAPLLLHASNNAIALWMIRSFGVG